MKKIIILLLWISTTSPLTRKDIPKKFRLHMAALKGSNKRIKELLDSGDYTIDDSCPIGSTPLHWAAAAGKKKTVEYLLLQGADPYVFCNDKLLPEHWAIRNHHFGVCLLLIQYRQLDLQGN